MTPPTPVVSAALLGLHPGHAHQPGQHDAGPHPLHAADLRGHGARRHGDGHQRAGGLPAEEGQGAAASDVCGGVQTPQAHLKQDRAAFKSSGKMPTCCRLKPPLGHHKSSLNYYFELFILG